ncbi:folylpolyglutamate synthase/dihydrofolate synthase family protein [Ventrimonas sp. CLA-AP-H27]|uniref:tetrahydrofolate synthase n=1 Tax=Ventrimonas faecis TaxID=3133170 RepID=A0ABV1HLM8_9FIRM
MIDKKARDYLLGIPLWTKKKNTLDEVRNFLEALGNPDEQLKIIHVAGTNGKGSVCADLTAMLMEAGYHVGTFVSPHLTDVTERFLLDGCPVEEAGFSESFTRVKAVTDKLTAEGYAHPTFFEFVFLMAMDLYGRMKPDFVVLETGLGGRLDTTNVIRHPLACVITSISLDHTQYLGDTVELIAAEKAGIIKQGVPVVYDNNDQAAGAVIAAAAKRLGSAAYGLTAADSYREVSFAAPYQAMNAALAVKVLNVLDVAGVTAQVCKKALASVHWTGRMQQVAPNVWVDGAHNPGGIRAFIQAVKAQNSGNIRLLFAAVSDKDYHEMIRLLCTELAPESVTVVQLKSERGLQVDALAKQFEEAGCSQVTAFDSTKDALEHVLSEKKEEDRLYMVGSLYLIGEILEDLKLRKRG